MISIEGFCRKYSACGPGREWALANCATMQECWDKAKPEWVVWIATQTGVLTDRELHEFALWSATQVRHLMKDERSTHALDVRRRWLDGNATEDEMAAASAAALAAAGAAALDAADAEELDAALAASRATSLATPWAATAWGTASATAWAAAWAAARDVAWDAARDVAWDEAWDEALAAQASWLRENTKPNFEN